ncbi:GNAT family N-acetyltransferase [Pollutibacter soli]|uniref:GNAT family N-acetyltransferase n=1 Tax=Pollutibacter soli TaxID=3034157 RepID=UPI0030133B41
MISVEKAAPSELAVVQKLATTIWNIVYPPIISREQIDYMLEMMYSDSALEKQTSQQHQFLLVKENEEPLGFASYSPKEPGNGSVFRLHKLYVLPDQHGKGLGKKLLAYIKNEITPLGAKALELNVNKKNPAVGFYQKMGFAVDREMILDIGNGYVMDDYVMTLHYQ